MISLPALSEILRGAGFLPQAIRAFAGLIMTGSMFLQRVSATRNGLGISPDGSTVLTSVQEGTWTPASAICDVSFGGHFGAGGPREGERGYVPPMLYLPRGVDNSSGGQVFIDSGKWGPLSGQWVHFSSGFSKHFILLRESLDKSSQGAAVVLPGSFLAGSHRGRFSPYDGQLYVTGSQGWGNYGIADGALQRVRYNNQSEKFPYPVDFEVRENGVLLTFANEDQFPRLIIKSGTLSTGIIDMARVTDPENIRFRIRIELAMTGSKFFPFKGPRWVQNFSSRFLRSSRSISSTFILMIGKESSSLQRSINLENRSLIIRATEN
jgi:hypothetical protein